MTYILIMMAIAVLPLAAGYAWARKRGETPTRNLPAAIIAGLAAGAWFGVSWAARRYAETELPGWSFAEWWAQSGKWLVFAVGMLFFLGYALGTEKARMSRLRAVLCAMAVLLVIWMTVWRTMPVYAFLPADSQRDADGLMIQRVQYTCGPVSLANLLERYYGATGVSERKLARQSGTTYEGTTVNGLIRAAEKSGLRVAVCRKLTLAELEERKSPAIVFISTIPSVRHATLFTGINGDDVTFIDPDRGYWQCTRERFRTIWYGKTLVFIRQ